MIELAHLSLCLALGLTLLQLYAGATGQGTLARRAALGQGLATLAAFAGLGWAYLSSDFSVANVYENSHTAKPIFYKFTGVWANHEGSMLLWLLVLAGYGAAFAVPTANTLRQRALAVLALVMLGFQLFVLTTSNPFLRLVPAAPEGQGMNPLLQDPALAAHPPFLYLGYIGMAVPFALAVAALWSREAGQEVFGLIRRWTLVPWAFLTVGIMLGSWWAYYELGWGGWWFWDPVENASLLPWLLATALFHSAIVTARRGSLAGWTLLLALLTFLLSMTGAFLVRSGVLTSVHTFAVSPERGTFLLVLLAGIGGGSLLLYALRAGKLPVARKGFAPLSREGGILLNNLFLAAAAATVFLGTLWPLFTQVMGLPPVSVGAPYFNMTFIPLMLPLMLALGFSPFLAWGRDRPRRLLQKVVKVLPFTLLPLVAVLVMGGKLAVAAGLAMAGWLVGSVVVDAVQRWRQKAPLPWGMMLGHLGLGIAIAGMVTASLAKLETSIWLEPGQMATFAGQEIRFERVYQVPGPNYQAAVAELAVNGMVARPEKRWFPVRGMMTTEVALQPHRLGDIYIVLGDRQPDGQAWSFLLQYNPGIHLIWIGAVVMAMGALWAAYNNVFKAKTLNH